MANAGEITERAREGKEDGPSLWWRVYSSVLQSSIGAGGVPE